MIKAIMKIHTTSSTVTFVCGDVAIIGNGEFRASSGKVDGFILYADTLQYENGAKLSRDEQENLKCLYQHFVCVQKFPLASSFISLSVSSSDVSRSDFFFP